MDRTEDPFIVLAAEGPGVDSVTRERRAVSLSSGARSLASLGPAAVARLHGFDLLDRPVVADLPSCPGALLAARTTVSLRQAMIGRDVLVLFDGADVDRPIIIGVIEPVGYAETSSSSESGITVHADGQRHVIEAEREIVLRCGDASITLTRAGKVLIQGNYILSRSSGYNKIKGAAIEIN